jgi:hypothetical protein
MRYDRLIIGPIPTVEFDAPTAGQQYLTVHLDRALPAQLPTRQVGVVRRVDEVVRQWLVHVLEDGESVQKHRGISVGRQVMDKAIDGEDFWKESKSSASGWYTAAEAITILLLLFVRFKGVDDFHTPCLIVDRMQNFVQTRVTLLSIQKRGQYLDRYLIAWTILYTEEKKASKLFKMNRKTHSCR